MVKMTALYHDHSHTADGGTQEIRLSEKSLVGDGSVGSRAAESAMRPRGQLRVAHQGRETTPKDPWQAKLQHRPRRLSAARAGQTGLPGAPSWGGPRILAAIGSGEASCRLASIDRVSSSPSVLCC